MVLAETDETDVAKHDQLIVAADFLERSLQVGARIDFIAREHLAIAARDPAGRVDQALASRIVASPADQRSHRGFRLGLARPVPFGGAIAFGRGRGSGLDRQPGRVEVLVEVELVAAVGHEVGS